MTVLIVLVCVSPLFLNPIDDAAAHIARLQGLVDNINQMGILGAIRNWKIYFSMMHGSGYGYPMFYGDILLWPFALALIGLENMGILGRDSESAFLMYKVILQISLWLTFIQAYICQSKAIKNKLIKVTKSNDDRAFSDKDLSFLIAFFYLMTPYIVMTLHNQSYRVAAYGIVPWVIYNLVQILYKSDDEATGIDKYHCLNILGLAVQMWLLLETHLITTLYVSIVLMIIYVRYLIVDKSTVKEKIDRTIYVGIAAVMCIILSFEFLTEMLKQLGAGYLVVSNTTNDLGQKYSTQLIGTFIPEWMVAQFGDITGIYDSQKIHFGSVGYIGFYYIGLIILGIVGIVQSKEKSDETEKLSRIKKLQVIQIVYSIIYFILMGTSIFQKLLEFTQFRYRLNTMLDIGLICIGICWITSEISDKTINKIVKYILIVQSITVFGNIAYSSMLDIGRGDLSIQVGGGAEYLQFNSNYDIFEQTRDDYPLHYDVKSQVTDMLKYKKDFEDNLETIGYDHEYTVGDTGLIYWFDIDKTTLGWLEAIQDSNDGDGSEKNLVVPVTYYKGIYRATIEKVGTNGQTELVELSINKSDLGYCQIDDSDIQQVIGKDPDGLRYRITIQYIG